MRRVLALSLCLSLCLFLAPSCAHDEAGPGGEPSSSSKPELTLLQGAWAVGPDENFVYRFDGDELMIQTLEPRHRWVVDGDLLTATDANGREVLRATIVSLTSTALTLRDPKSGHTAVFIHPF